MIPPALARAARYPPPQVSGCAFPGNRQTLDTMPSVSWFYVHSANFFGGGTLRQTLLSVRRNPQPLQEEINAVG